MNEVNIMEIFIPCEEISSGIEDIMQPLIRTKNVGHCGYILHDMGTIRKHYHIFFTIDANEKGINEFCNKWFPGVNRYNWTKMIDNENNSFTENLKFLLFYLLNDNGLGLSKLGHPTYKLDNLVCNFDHKVLMKGW